MLAASFEKYLHKYNVVPDENPVIFTNNSSTFSLVKSLIDLGHKPKAYVDARDQKKIEKEILDILTKSSPSWTNHLTEKNENDSLGRSICDKFFSLTSIND